MILMCNVHGRRRSASRKQKTAVKLIFALTSISSDFNDKKVGGAKRALAFTLTYYSFFLVFFAIAIWHYSTAYVNVDVVNIGLGADRGCPC